MLKLQTNKLGYIAIENDFCYTISSAISLMLHLLCLMATNIFNQFYIETMLIVFYLCLQVATIKPNICYIFRKVDSIEDPLLSCHTETKEGQTECLVYSLPHVYLHWIWYSDCSYLNAGYGCVFFFYLIQ